MDRSIGISHPKGFKVANAMKTSMINRGFASHVNNRVSKIATILDPMYKIHAFSSPEAREEAVRALYEAAANIHPEQGN